MADGCTNRAGIKAAARNRPLPGVAVVRWGLLAFCSPSGTGASITHGNDSD